MKMQKISASGIRCWKECRRKYHFIYNENLRPQVTAPAFRFGSLVHTGLAQILQWASADELHGMPTVGEIKTVLEKHDDGEPVDAVELYKAVHCLERWCFHYPIGAHKILAIEEYFEVPIGHGRRLRGYIDAIVEDTATGEQWVLEHKTAARFDERYMTRLLRDDQATAYIVGANKSGYNVKGVMYNILLKPSIRQKKSENREEYIERIKQWYHETNRIVIHNVYRDAEQQEIWLAEIEAVMADIRHAKYKQNYYPNASACSIYDCAFDSICLEDTPEVREGNFTERTGR